MSERWVDVEAVAEHLSVPRKTVYNLAADGRLPSWRVGGRLRFRLSLIDAWVESGGADGQGAEIVPLTGRRSA